MSDLYTSLQVSPRKKRALPDSDDDEFTVTPKRLRTTLPTPPSTGKRKHTNDAASKVVQLPDHLIRLHNTQTALQNALSHALATSSVAPTSDTGLVLAVLNHISLAAYSGLSTRFDSDELRRLCWLWEWDGKTVPAPTVQTGAQTKNDENLKYLTSTPTTTRQSSIIKDDEDENPFLDATPRAKQPKAAARTPTVVDDEDENPFLSSSPKTKQTKSGTPKTNVSRKGASSDSDDENPFVDGEEKPSEIKDWIRGGMGIVVSATTHYAKGAAKRLPAYGIGIEVEMDLDKEMMGGIAAIARWTAGNETRRGDLRKKLEKWQELHKNVAPIPSIPIADLPPLAGPTQPSNLTRLLASASPKAPASIAILQTPSSPSRSPSKSPSKRSSPLKPLFAVPFPVASGSVTSRPGTPSKSSILFPKTPSTRHSRSELAASLFGSRTPSSRGSSLSPTRSDSSSSLSGTPFPSTPRHQRGSDAETAPSTPSSSRRQALYERIRQKSLTTSPTKSVTSSQDMPTGSMSRDQVLKMSQEETRRRCLLGRLSGVAESVWMLFSAPVGSSSMTPTMRKRRMMPTTEVVSAIIKSSSVPISLAEAQESVTLLTTLCPFFLKAVDITGQEWLEMPATVNDSQADKAMPESPTKPRGKLPVPASPVRGSRSPSRISASPGRNKDFDAQDLVTGSPRRLKAEAGGLRLVRERVRRELELHE